MKLSRPAFDVDGVTVPMGCVAASGMISGRVMDDFQTLRDRMACDALLEAAQEGFTGKEITPVLNGWRNAHGLTSAEMTGKWLEAFDVTLDDLVAHVSRSMAIEKVGDQLEVARTNTPVPLPVALQNLLHHLLFTDRLSELVQDVAMRAAADEPSDKGVFERERRAVMTEIEHVGGVEGVSAMFELPVELGLQVVAMEARFRIADREACAPDLMERELRRARRGLTRIEYAQAVFPNDGMALEVTASLKEDSQMWLEQIAHRLGVEPTRRERYVDDLNESAIATKLSTGRVGDVMGPEATPAGFAVYEVLSRTEPRLTDADVRNRIQNTLRRRTFASAIERRIRFHFT